LSEDDSEDKPSFIARMPFRYSIDKARRLAIIIGEGCISSAQIRDLRKQGLSDPDFDRELNQLMDLRAVTKVDISSREIEALAETTVFSPNSRTALLASDPSVFGMQRMYAIYNEMSKAASQFRAFYDLPSALQWLGMESLPEAKSPEGEKT
jgi:hypothetical protein